VVSRTRSTLETPVRVQPGPFRALVSNDIANQFRSWLVRGWLAGSALVALIVVVTASGQTTEASRVVSGGLSLYLFALSVVVILVAASAVSSEAGVLADAILSRAVTRDDYLLAKFTARLLVIGAAYLAVVAPFVALTARYTENDLTAAGTALGVLMVLFLLLFLGTLGVALSAALNNTVLAVAVLAVCWYFAGAALSFLEVGFLSPEEIVNDLDAMVAGRFELGREIARLGTLYALSALTLAVSVVNFRRRDVL
jgi:ABC-type transport system involved in multi-copper enzyme maturation permease subunit